MRRYVSVPPDPRRMRHERQGGTSGRVILFWVLVALGVFWAAVIYLLVRAL